VKGNVPVARTARGLTVVVALLTALALVPPAHAEPGHPGPGSNPKLTLAPGAGKPYPSQAEVDRARKEMELRAQSVDQIDAALAAAGQRAAQAAEVAEVAAERYNASRWDLRQAKLAAVKAERRARVARERVEVQRAGIAALATQSYQDGTALNGITAFMSGGAPSEVMQRLGVAETAGVSMKLKYDVFAALAQAAEKAEDDARKARVAARKLAADATTARSLAAFATLAARNATGRIGGTEARLRASYAEAETKFRKLAEDRQDALRRLRDKNVRNNPGPERPLPPAPKKERGPRVHHGIADDTSMVIPRTYPGPVTHPPRPDPEAARRAIAFAEDQLGDMYLWAATGPDRWDCSGLTMKAWAAGGVRLPHYSEAQYLASTPISAADLQPGDLVFWQGAQERIHHVALYIGDGEILHAERTGEPVKIVAMTDFTPPDYFGRPHR
jgi:cell wall-associated NlpC family hydrolase